MAAPSSRPLHPCILPVMEGSQGVEYSTWARIFPSEEQLPNLVTALNSSLRICSISSSSPTKDGATGKLLLEESFDDLSGSICYLDTLKSPDPSEPDSLLVGFAGHPRLGIVQVVQAPTTLTTASATLLRATSLMDLTPLLVEGCMGAMTPLEQDLMATRLQTQPNSVTLAVVLGGGVAVACLSIQRIKSASGQTGWHASEPYLLPLAELYKSSLVSDQPQQQQNQSSNQASIAHGFGDILSVCFLTSYREPTLALLHGMARTWSGRMGRPEGEGGSGNALSVTALTLTVAHERSAILWSTLVPAEANELHSISKGCLVLGINTLLSINNAGRPGQVLAVNGWAKATCPTSLLGQLRPNPWPLPRLSLALDGAKVSFVKDDVAILSLRRGALYMLQQIEELWSLIPLSQTLGALGQVSDLVALPMHNVPAGLLEVTAKNNKNTGYPSLGMGLFFAASRLGDSSLMLFTIEPNVTLMDAADVASKNKKGLQSNEKVKQEEVEDEYEIMLRREEEALYKDDDTEMEDGQRGPAIIPPSEDEYEQEEDDNEEEKAIKRAKLSRVSLLRSLTALDSLTATGPLGLGCEGPTGAAVEQEPEKQAGAVSGSPSSATTWVGGTAQVMPCGFGSSGGLAVLGTPGHDERVMVAEADCLQMECLFSLTKRDLILVGKKTVGTTIMRSKGGDLSEMPIEDWCGETPATKQGTFEDVLFLLEHATLLYATELHDDSVFIVVRSDEFAMNVMAILSGADGKVQVRAQEEVANDMGAPLLSVTPVLLHEHSATFGCVWESGNATVVTLNSNGKGASEKAIIQGVMQVDDEAKEHDGDADDDEKRFYRCNRITAMDVFLGPQRAFSMRDAVMEDVDESERDDYEDDEERELYAEPELATMKSQTAFETSPAENNATTTYVAVCRQSSVLEVFELASLLKGIAEPAWSSTSCGLGVFELSGNASTRLPKFHQVYTSEIRFFSTDNGGQGNVSIRRGSFRIILETNIGDVHVYTERRGGGGFAKESLRFAGRPSKDSSRLHTKLRSKNMLSKTVVDDHVANLATFRPNRLHRFTRIAGKNGLFAATSRPMWLVSERGSLKVLHHRSRHVAPAGGSSRPVRSFCSANHAKAPSATYVTLHERIGRVGSQRLTVFSDLPGVSSPHGLLPGGGYTIQKIPFGVTVRAIRFIDDPQVSTRSHPLYAVLVSRELEENQSQLNDDGLTPGERKRLEDEKEAAKVQRQVEADLGGFDVEQEWVEEIERENCFKISTSLGGAPPIAKSVYALWIVDAGDNWNVVDSYELPEFEHGMELNVMKLTEVPDDPNSNNRGDNNANPEPPELGPDTLFVTVGTAILDADGEDVSAKGRVLLFHVKRQEVVSPTSPVAELTLVHEKDISHGPVTSLSCLECEGKSRLIIGAGADVNVEQWGKKHLTQVGFFRATMQILKIQLFKTFFLLSDAYDSLNFLVWRESDKSLTLLAKDYEPTPVYAAGFMSRGAVMSFVCHDDRQNLQFFQYAPGDAAARGGNKLVCRADIHLGAQTIGIQSHFCKSSLLVNSSTPTSTLAALKSQDPLVGKSDDDQRIGAFFGTSDGNFCSVVPLSEPAYWRMAALQSVMANALESHCALNQRAWRLYRRTPRRGGCRSNDRRKGVIDGSLVISFTDLSLPDQEDLASAIGSTVEMIVDNLVELKCSTMIM